MSRWFQAVDKGWVATCCGIGLPIVVSAALVPFRGNFAAPAAALVLVLVVVGVASLGTRIAGGLAAV